MLEDFLKRVRAIEIVSRRLVQKGMIGAYRSAFRGTGMQFREFRQYVYGDDVRHISWNVSARSEETVLKVFEEERERTLFQVVDVSASLRKGPWARRKAERLAEIMATLALSAAESSDRMGLLLFSDKVEKVIAPRKGRTHLLRLIRDVMYFAPHGRHTDPDIALKQLDTVLKKQSIVFFLSDFEVAPSVDVLRKTRALHDFIAIGVEDPSEWILPNTGFVEMETAEAGRPVTVDSSSPALRDYLRAHGQTRRQLAEDHCRRAGVDLLWVDTTEDYGHKLLEFFRGRARRR